MTLDTGQEPCQSAIVTEPVSHSETCAPCGSRFWFVVRTGPGSDQLVADIEIRLAGFEVLNPSLWKPATRPRLGRPGLPDRIVPLFSRYLMTRFDRDDPGWRRIRSLRGVECILGGTPARPVPVPHKAIEALRATLAPNACLYPVTRHATPITTGASVRVLEGPFADHVGLCQMSDGLRVRLLLELLGRPVQVTVAQSAVGVV